MRPGDLLEQRYRLVRVLGRGRSGSVWCARNELIDRAVAVKVLHRSLASDAERLQRFFQEARACGRVRHPAVVEVLDLGQADDGVLFLVMELLDGETMASLLARKGRLSTDEALSIVVPLAHGLGAAHAHGILHRDLKPANIYLHKTPTGGLQPKILDFGISKIIGNDVTATGVVLGTPSYMSPEQARGVPDLDPRTDVWSLGVILYEALTGRLPFVAKDYRALVDEILERRHPGVRELAPEVPDEVARVVDEALEKSRDRRLPSASAMAQKLTAILRARGRDDVLRDPEDDFSEGAPTLARERSKLGAHTQPIERATAPKPAKAAEPEPGDDDVTIGDAHALPAATPAPATNLSITRQGTGPERPHAEARRPSAVTAAIAAQTSGAKRLHTEPLPRPAAGAPARPSSIRDLRAAAPVREEPTPEETKPDPLPLQAKKGASPEPARPATTQSWEVSAAQAASGRAEVILGSGVDSSASIQVSDDWDTTVADVVAVDLVKGPLPKLAPAPPPAFSEPPPVARPARATQMRIAQSEQPPKKPASIGAIPGFSAAATPPPGAMVAVQTRASTPPPPPARLAAIDPEAAPKKTTPPRPPPRTIPPANGPPANGAPRATLRPPVDGFAVPALVNGGHAPHAPANADRRVDAPLVAPELLSLGRPAPPPPPPIAPAPEPEPVAESRAPQSDPHFPRAGAPVVLPGPTSAPGEASDPNLETDKHRRVASSIVPLMIAAVALLFVLGAAVGTFAASRRGGDHHVQRFTRSTGVLVAWHDHAARAAREAEAEEKKKTKDLAQQKALEAELAAKAAAAAPPPPPPPVEPEPAASASAEPVATAALAPPEPAPKPAAVAKPAPKPAAKPAPKPAPKPTSTKPTSKPTPTKKPAPAPKTKSGDKEWWQKKF